MTNVDMDKFALKNISYLTARLRWNSTYDANMKSSKLSAML